MSELGYRVRNFLGKAGILPERPLQLTLEEIHMPQVSATILDYLGNPMAAREGNRWQNPFSTETVIGNMNIKMSDKRGRKQAFDVIEERLQNLVTAGALEVIETETGNFYTVTNERCLELIAYPRNQEKYW